MRQIERFLSSGDLETVQRFRLLREYLDSNHARIDSWNEKLEAQWQTLLNQRRITNIGCFRAYIDQYLIQHPDIRPDLLQMARQRDPSPEVYHWKSMLPPGRPDGDHLNKYRQTSLITCWQFCPVSGCAFTRAPRGVICGIWEPDRQGLSDKAVN